MHTIEKLLTLNELVRLHKRWTCWLSYWSL